MDIMEIVIELLYGHLTPTEAIAINNLPEDQRRDAVIFHSYTILERLMRDRA